MPVTSYSKTLVSPGDTLQVPLTQINYGQQGQCAYFLLFLSGNFQQVTLDVIGFGIGPNPSPPPLTLNLLTPGGEVPTPTPLTLAALNTIAGFANGVVYSCCCPVFRQVNIVLASLTPLAAGGFNYVSVVGETISYP